MIHLTCAQNDLAPIDCSAIRWLDRDADFDLARELWAACGYELTRADWVEAHNAEYTYAAIVEAGMISHAQPCGATQTKHGKLLPSSLARVIANAGIPNA